jgi:hypothetical protein
MGNSDYTFWNSPNTVDSMKWKLVRYLSSANPGIEGGQFLLSPEVLGSGPIDLASAA